MDEKTLKSALKNVQKTMNKMKKVLLIDTIKIPANSTISEMSDIIAKAVGAIPTDVVTQIKSGENEELKEFGQGYNAVAKEVKMFLDAQKSEPVDLGTTQTLPIENQQPISSGDTPSPRKKRSAPVDVKINPDDIVMDLFKMLSTKQIAGVKPKHQTYILQLVGKK